MIRKVLKIIIFIFILTNILLIAQGNSSAKEAQQIDIKLVRTMMGHTMAINSIDFSPNGKYLISGGYDKTVKMWNLEPGKFSNNIFIGEYGDILKVKYLDNGMIVASSGNGVFLFQKPTQEINEGEIKKNVISELVNQRGINCRDNKKNVQAYMICHGTALEVYNENEKRLKEKGLVFLGAADLSRSFDISHDGKVLVFSGLKSTPLDRNFWAIVIVSTGSRKDRESLKNHYSPKKIMNNNSVFFKGHKYLINSVEFSPDNRLLASGDEAGVVILWDVSKAKKIQRLRGHKNWVKSVTFSPDGKLLASGSFDKTIIIWDVQKKKKIRTLKGHTDGIWEVAFSPDGRLLASASQDKTVKLWDPTTGNLLTTINGHTDYVYCVAFSPDGKYLATAGLDTTIKIWEIKWSNETVGH